jgi:hypothetical protein
VQSGVAVTVATHDEDLRPAVTHGWGPEVSSGGRVLALLVAAPPGSQTRENLEGNGAIAVGFGLPTVARAVQVKGAAAAVREVGPAELERAERHLRLFCTEAGQFGIPERLARRMFPQQSDLVAVTFPIEEAFDQTPGPTAGQHL